eukprot:583012-Prymnesium_polylepis.1
MPGGMEQYFDDAPPDGFGPRFDLKAWLKVGCPTADRGVHWFKMMQACFELPTREARGPVQPHSPLLG